MSSPFLSLQFLSSCLQNSRQYIYKFYNSTQENLGYHKRDRLVINVQTACVTLETCRDQFTNALEQFKILVPVANAQLEHNYYALKRQYHFCQQKAYQTQQRIQAIEQLSAALFAEWDAELSLYNNRTLRSRSRSQLKIARQQYNRLIKNLSKAEAKMQPVLAAFYDQVLFLKHNLNAQAIAALQHEFTAIAVDIKQLIVVMEKSIAEANQFVAALVEQKALPKL